MSAHEIANEVNASVEVLAECSECGTLHMQAMVHYIEASIAGTPMVCLRCDKEAEASSGVVVLAE